MNQSQSRSKFAELRSLDVSKYIEKKQNLSYLSWAWAVDQLLLSDPDATWEYKWFGDLPYCRIGETAMVFCSVTANGVTRTAQLPVMDHRNKAIPNPDSFAVNTAMQRCLAKGIALHGIGLYVYAGEDLPEETKEQMDEEAKKREDAERAELEERARKQTDHLTAIDSAENAEALEKAAREAKEWATKYKDRQAWASFSQHEKARKKQLGIEAAA
jgi:DNA-binding transcriptional MerR regulator